MTTSRRKTTIVYTGGFVGTQELEAAANTSSPAEVVLVNLAGIEAGGDGVNTIAVPPGATAVTIVPPTDNTQAISLMGVANDPKLRIHNTDQTTLALDESVASFALYVSVSVLSVRLYWS